MKKIKGNIFLWLIGGFILLAVIKKLFKSNVTTPAAEVASAPSTELGYLFSTGDWTHTVPGKAIEGWLGQGTANWVIWTTIVVLVLFFVRDLVSKDKKLGNIFNVLYVCAAAVFAAMLFGGTLQTYDKLKEVSVTPPVEFRGVHKAKPKVVMMAFNTIAVASLDMGHVSTGPNWACPEVIKPAKLPFDVYFEVVTGKDSTQNHIMLTKESQQALLENGTMAVAVRFTHQTAHQNPCAYLR